MMNLGPWQVAHGDRVTFRNARGDVCRGRVNGLLVFPTHAVLDMGGRYGTPQVVRPDSIIAVTRRGAK